MHLAEQRRDWREASATFAAAHARSGASQDAYDAGRALHPADPDGAVAWFRRIPPDERDGYPRLAYYTARDAFARGVRGATLHAHYAALRSFLFSSEGRRYPGAQELAAQIAWTLGDPIAARAHADADGRLRAERARPHLDQAAAALEDGELDRARAALAVAAPLVPGRERVALLTAELSHSSGSTEGVERALRMLQQWAGTDEHANVTENRFRTRHGLPLRSERGPRPPGE
jgi:hypothetical protein